MKKAVWLGLASIVAVSALFAACGGDDDGDSDNSGGDQTSSITVNKGAAVQALLTNLQAGQGAGADAASDEAALPASGDLASADGRSSSSNVGGDTDASVNGQVTSDGAGVTVQGYGSATADADSAIIEFYFGGMIYYEDKPIAEPGVGSDGSTGSVPPDIAPSPNAEPITEEALQPVIDALVGAGVSRDNIEFVDPGYYDPYYSSATLRATLDNVDGVDAAVAAATAATLDGISLQSSNVTYTISDCSALEQAAMEAAVEDAADRGQLLATALGVELGGITGAADYSYYGYGGTGCGSSYPMPYYDTAVRGSSSTQVQVFEQISITYAIQ